jgi:hypothetical protein
MSEKKVPYHRYAFHNIYNYTLLGGVAAAAALTGNWWLAVVGGGLETLWMVFGPDSKILQKKVFDKTHEEHLKQKQHEDLHKMLGHLAIEDARRYEKLETRSQDILRLCSQNQSFTSDLLREELTKLDKLKASFLELLTACSRYEEYLSKVDLDALDDEIRRHNRTLEASTDEDRKGLAKKNLEVLEKRRERLAEIKRFVVRAHGQMDLIENTFELLGDQIVTMSSPRELGGQLDELIDGVEAVRSTAREAAAFIEAVNQ